MADQTDPAPAISVVVPTFERPERVSRLVRALLSTQQPSGGFEVVVVDDGSRDDTAAVLARLREHDGRVRTERNPTNRGAGAARNRGWRAARAPLIAFIDDDCVPRPGWLTGLLAGFEAGADMVQGRVEPDPGPYAQRGPFFETARVEGIKRWFETCNIGYRRELLASLDGFDEAFTGASLGEDMDLGWRALDAGAVLVFRADAVVVHDVRDDVVGWLRARWRRRTMPYLAKKHPRIREGQPLGVFGAPEHLRACLAAVGVGVALAGGRRPAPLLTAAGLTGQYAHFRLRRRPLGGRRRDWLWALPIVWAGELAETAIMAWASWRERFVLL